jgi:hypothetical protein
MIGFVYVRDKKRDVFEGDFKMVNGVSTFVKSSELLGTISDSCCFTNIKVGNFKNLVFYNESGKGGFLKSNMFLEEIMEAWNYINDNEAIQKRLSKNSIRIDKKDIPNWKRELEKRI